MKKLTFTLLLLVVLIGLCAAINGNQSRSGNPARDNGPEGPYNLEAQLIGDNDILLVWENPVYANLPFEFHVYCNNHCVRHIPGTNVTDYLLENVCAGCHQLYVAASFDTGCESLPSNTVEVTVTSLNDNVLPTPEITMEAYPNPSRGEINIALNGVKFGENTIAIVNEKGQKIRQISIGSGQTGQWDGKDTTGKKVSEGIYFLKATTSKGSVTQKIILVR
jgi:hypothetical protein